MGLSWLNSNLNIKLVDKHGVSCFKCKVSFPLGFYNFGQYFGTLSVCYNYAFQAQ